METPSVYIPIDRWLALARGAPLSPAEQTQLERMLEPVGQTLNDTAQAAALGDGRAMSLEQAVDYALSASQASPQ